MIDVRNLWVDLGPFLLQDIDLNIRPGEYFMVLGPTGAGKTILLETIAGLYPVKSGEIWLNGREITKLEPEKRGLGFVYQDYALFPHMSVEDNIGFGLRQRKKPKPEVQATVNQLAEWLGVPHLLKRRPNTLSGGERQKVALARALSIQPEVLLLDEPLSALDPEAREGTRRELRRIHEQMKLTIIHVTHDFEEAVALGERIAVLGEGRVMQVGTPEEIFRRPNSEFVARFAMTRNIFTGEVRDSDGEYATLNAGGLELTVVTELRGRVHASIRPEDILLSREPVRSSARNSFRGIITAIDDRGSTLYLTVDLPGTHDLSLISLVTRRSFEELDLSTGKEVYLTFKASAVHAF